MKTVRLGPAAAAFTAAIALAAGIALGAGMQLHASTKADLSNAMHGEAFAYAKYMLFAQQARTEGNAQLAALFEHTANVELSNHFRTHAYEYGLVGNDKQNLQNAITGENYETTTMYPDMAKRAQAVGDSKVAAIFSAVAKDEALHRDRFQSALKELASR